MAGTVFLSCGQNDRELKIAERIATLLREPPFGLNVFIARSTNNLYSLNNDVLTNLAYADYVLFVNFRRKTAGFPGSIYAHQELAMALALGHQRILLFSEKGAPNAGVIQFMVLNLRIHRPSIFRPGRARPASEAAEEIIKPLLARLHRKRRLADMPLADVRGVVAGGLERLSNGESVGWEATPR